MQDEVWIPLVDEPIGAIVAQLESEHEDLRRLIDSPQKLLAFRTFAFIRVGIVLGLLLVELALDQLSLVVEPDDVVHEGVLDLPVETVGFDGVGVVVSYDP